MTIEVEHIASGLMVADDLSWRVMVTRSFRVTPPDAPMDGVLPALLRQPRYRRISEVLSVDPLVEALLGPDVEDETDPRYLVHGPYLPDAVTPAAFSASRDEALAQFDHWSADPGMGGRTPGPRFTDTVTTVRALIEQASQVLVMRSDLGPEARHELDWMAEHFREIVVLDRGRVHVIVLDID